MYELTGSTTNRMEFKTVEEIVAHLNDRIGFYVNAVSFRKEQDIVIKKRGSLVIIKVYSKGKLASRSYYKVQHKIDIDVNRLELRY